MFSMIARKGTFYLGIFVFIIPFLGFPTAWKMFLVVVAGLSMILYSVRVPFPKKSFKQKIKKDTYPIETIVPEVKPEIKQEVVIPVVDMSPVSPIVSVQTPPIIKIEPVVKKARKPRASSSTKKITKE